jgi:hypothetical protein
VLFSDHVQVEMDGKPGFVQHYGKFHGKKTGPFGLQKPHENQLQIPSVVQNKTPQKTPEVLMVA